MISNTPRSGHFHSRPRGPLGLPANREEALAILDALTGSRVATYALLQGRLPRSELAGNRQLTDALTKSGPLRLAQATTGTLNDAGGIRISPSDRSIPGRVERLPTGALRIGNAVITAAILLQEVQRGYARAQVDAAIAKFGLDRTQAVDILAARAYVWGQNMAPVAYWDVPYSGPVNERVAEAIMRHERDNPGTLGLATRGHTGAKNALDTIVAHAVAGTALPGVAELAYYRTSLVDPALSADSDRCRERVDIADKPNWRAHHLIPFAVVASLPVPVQKAMVKAGWSLDRKENLMALPANLETYSRLLAGERGPIHNSSHAMYSANVLLELQRVITQGAVMSGPELMAELSRIENHFREELIQNVRLYHIYLR